MFSCDHTKLRLSFNEFHPMEAGDTPEYGDFCLIELKDGSLTGGTWYPGGKGDGRSVSGEFGRGTADSVDAGEVSMWHKLRCYDLTECLEDADTGFINLGPKEEGAHTVQIGDFRSLSGGSFPKSEQYCLLILNDGTLGAGRWDEYEKDKSGSFIYASALASYSMKKVWAWTPLGSDSIFAAEEEMEAEMLREEELNRNPSADSELFRYGTDIDVYYEKALEKLREEYPWASITQMRKETPYVIAPLHGKYVFGQEGGSYRGRRYITEWTEGSTADEFIDFLCEYTREAVKNSDPGEKFRYGTDIGVYIKKAFEHVKKDYTWLDEDTAASYWKYSIETVDGEQEFVRRYKDNKEGWTVGCSTAEEFIESVEHDLQEAALDANPAVAEYAVPFGHVETHGWNLERYSFYRLSTGDYKAYVQAGDRVAGGSREFFITPYCFEAETYDEFLDRYLEIVPGWSFGLYKENLLEDEELKKFLGY